jgi:hypothetical protein
MHIVIDKEGNPIGLFNTATEAAQWAAKTWPTEEQDQEYPGVLMRGDGWEVIALRAPW